MRRYLIAVLLLGSSAASHAGTPQINVGSLFDYMEAGKSQLLKRVRNSGDATAYVRVEITRMHYAADGKVTESPVDAAALARSETGHSGLLASPSRLIIAANQGQQTTRLVFRGERAHEQYYRVRYVPVVPDAGEFSLDAEQSEQYRDGVSAGVNVFTGYGTVVFVPPTNAYYQTRIDGNQVSNGGNATVVLDALKQCLIAKPDDCSSSAKVHIRPGQSYTLPQDPQRFVRYDLKEGTTIRAVDSRR